MAGKQRLNHAYVVAGGTHVSLAVSRPCEWAPGHLQRDLPGTPTRTESPVASGRLLRVRHVRVQVHSDPKALHKPPGGCKGGLWVLQAARWSVRRSGTVEAAGGPFTSFQVPGHSGIYYVSRYLSRWSRATVAPVRDVLTKEGKAERYMVGSAAWNPTGKYPVPTNIPT